MSFQPPGLRKSDTLGTRMNASFAKFAGPPPRAMRFWQIAVQLGSVAALAGSWIVPCGVRKLPPAMVELVGYTYVSAFWAHVRSRSQDSLWSKKPAEKRKLPLSPDRPVVASASNVFASPLYETPYCAPNSVPLKALRVMTFTTPAIASEP